CAHPTSSAILRTLPSASWSPTTSAPDASIAAATWPMSTTLPPIQMLNDITVSSVGPSSIRVPDSSSATSGTAPVALVVSVVSTVVWASVTSGGSLPWLSSEHPAASSSASAVTPPVVPTKRARIASPPPQSGVILPPRPTPSRQVDAQSDRAVVAGVGAQ